MSENTEEGNIMEKGCVVVRIKRYPRDLKDLPEPSSSLPMTEEHRQQVSLIEQKCRVRK